MEKLREISLESARQTYLNKYAINSNLLESAKFVMVTHNQPYLNFFATGVTLPSVASGEIMHETPFSTIWRAGDKLQYEPLIITFLVDEDLKVWEELHDWIRGYTFPTDRSEYSKQKEKGIYTDFTLFLLKNSHETNLQFRFRNGFPTSVGPVSFSSGDSADNVLSTDVSFRYDYFDIIRGNQ